MPYISFRGAVYREATGEITHRRNPDGDYEQIVLPKRLREILDEQGNSYDPPSDFGSEDAWDVDERKPTRRRTGRDSGTLRDSDKAVIRAFADQKPLSNRSKLLSTDGQTLEKFGLGGQKVAHWEDGAVVIDAVMDARSTQAVLRYLRKVVPSRLFVDKTR